MFTENHAVFFGVPGAPAFFADDATLNGVAVVGILLKSYTNSLGVESRGLFFRMESAKVGTVAHGDTLIVRGVTHHIVEVHPDEAEDQTYLQLET
jgi:hypothetical protein